MGGCGSRTAVPDDPEDEHALPSKGPPVYLNVYDLQAGSGGSGVTPINGAMGFGFYHSGVEVFNVEYAFGGSAGNSPPGATGVFALPPKKAMPQQFYRQHVLGHLPASARPLQVSAIIQRLSSAWLAETYNVCARNCNHFSDALLAELNAMFHLHLEMPSYVNRAARVGSALAPKALLQRLHRAAPKADAQQQQHPHYGGPPHGHSHGTAASSTASPANPTVEHPLPSDRTELTKMSTRQLKTGLHVRGVDWTGCVEKSDLVDAAMAYHGSLSKQTASSGN